METIQPKIQKTLDDTKKNNIRTCAYCRVSTSSELQLNSFDAQVKHYTEYIQSNPDWEFVGIYADEGISGTSAKKRTDFMRMINDAKKNKIDLVICKSISRFGRNTTDILKYIRILKEYKVSVLFENENINTMTASGEVLISILASLAQDGSRQISENVIWGVDKAFKDGRVFGNNKALGYKIEEGKIVILEEEAKIIRFIFDCYVNGDGAVKIAKKLDELGIPTPLKSKRWNATTILNMLKNERYAGHLLQQKYFTVDYLSHKRLKNKGEIRQYLFKNNHEAIIDPVVWENVQLEIKRRRTLQKNESGRNTKHSNKYCWSGKLKCGKCESGFRRVVWHKKHVAWQCQGYVNYGKTHCDIGGIKEEILENLMISFQEYMSVNQDIITSQLQLVINKFIHQDTNDNKIKKIEKDINDNKDEISKLMSMCARDIISESEFSSKKIELIQEIEEWQTELEKQQQYFQNQTTQLNKLQNIFKYIGTLTPNTFDENFVRNMIDYIEVLERDHFEIHLTFDDICYHAKLTNGAFIYPTQDVLLNRYKCNLSHLFSKYSNLKEDYSNITVELYIAV